MDVKQPGPRFSSHLPALPEPLVAAARRGGAVGLLILILLVGLPLYVWFFCRIEPQAGEIAILHGETGQDLPSGEILAPGPDYKGIQLEVLPEGRYFRDPYHWDWEITRITDIHAGLLGCVPASTAATCPPGASVLMRTPRA